LLFWRSFATDEKQGPGRKPPWLGTGTFGNVDPACGGTRNLKQVEYVDHVGIVIAHSVAAGHADVDGAALDVASHLLRPDQAAPHLVVDLGEVAARDRRDAPAGLAEQLDHGFFEAALGDAEFQQFAHFAPLLWF
jgi:hypothetical protein